MRPSENANGLFRPERYIQSFVFRDTGCRDELGAEEPKSKS